MNNLNVVGVDLAKNVIQVSVVSPAGKELQNKALTRKKFSEFLARQKPSLVAFEACAMAHYWSRIAQRHGHTAKIIPAKAVTGCTIVPTNSTAHISVIFYLWTNCPAQSCKHNNA